MKEADFEHAEVITNQRSMLLYFLVSTYVFGSLKFFSAFFPSPRRGVAILLLSLLSRDVRDQEDQYEEKKLRVLRKKEGIFVFIKTLLRRGCRYTHQCKLSMHKHWAWAHIFLPCICNFL